MNMLIRSAHAFFLALALCLALSAQETAAPQFADGDRVCFVGDSITHGGLYAAYIKLFYATRYPERKIETHNCGISGDSAYGAAKRAEGDILAHKPTVATIMLGMNDVNRPIYGMENPSAEVLQKRENAIKGHASNMRILAKKLKDAGCRDLIFITPSIYDQTAKLTTENLFGVNDALITCAGLARELAKEFSGSVVDFNAPMLAVNASVQKDDPAATIVGKDRVHPGADGHLFMAYLFLKTQKVRSSVSEVVIDAAAKKTASADNCEVSGLSATDKAVAFTLAEKALPFPVPAKAAKVLAWAPFTEELNREMLAVTGLAPGEYALSIDGQPVGKYTHEQFAKGVNLAENAQTPQYRQAQEVAKANEAFHSIYANKLRNFVLIEIRMARQNVDVTDLEAVKAALNKELDDQRAKKDPRIEYNERMAKIYLDGKPTEAQLKKDAEAALAEMEAKNKPVPHKYEIARAAQ